MSEEKALARTETTALSTGTGLAAGFEFVDKTEISMPKIKCLQAMSPELDEEGTEFRKGDLIHSVLMEKVQDTFIPLLIWTSRVMFAPRDNQKRLDLFGKLGISDDGTTVMLCRARNGHTADMSIVGKSKCEGCPLAQWDGNTPPVCTNTINVLALMDGQEFPAVIQFANTNLKNGKKFRDLAMYTGKDLFSRRYKLTVKLEKNDKGSFYTTPVKPIGNLDPIEYEKAKELYLQYRNLNIDVEEDVSGETAFGEEA